MTRRISRRTFVIGIGGGAATASLVYGFWPTRWTRTSGEEQPIIAGCCAYTDHDGWLVTTVEKERLSLALGLVYTRGWYPKETDLESTWRWTHQTATLAFQNPKADATFSLEYAARPDIFAGTPQTVTVSLGDQVLQSFVADASGRRRRRIPLPGTALGNEDIAEIRITVDRTFVPANLMVGSRDTRELGIQVYDVFIEHNPPSQSP